MNRYAACEHIMWLKDLGHEEIYIEIDGKRYQVPTKNSGTPSTTISTLVDADSDVIRVGSDINPTGHNRLKKNETNAIS